MITCKQIVEDFTSWFKDQLEVQELDNTACLVSVPLMDPSNDVISVYVRYKDGKLILSDLGESFGYLYLHAVNPSHTKVANLNSKLKHVYGIEISGREMLLKTSQENLYTSILIMVQAILEVKHHRLVARMRTEPSDRFKTIVDKKFEGRALDFEKNYIIEVDNHEYSFDYIFNEKTVLDVVSVNDKSKANNRILHINFKSVQTRKVRKNGYILFLDDTIEENEGTLIWDRHYVSVLSKTNIEYYFWHQDEDKIEKKLEELSLPSLDDDDSFY